MSGWMPSQPGPSEKRHLDVESSGCDLADSKAQTLFPGTLILFMLFFRDILGPWFLCLGSYVWDRGIYVHRDPMLPIFNWHLPPGFIWQAGWHWIPLRGRVALGRGEAPETLFSFEKSQEVSQRPWGSFIPDSAPLQSADEWEFGVFPSRWKGAHQAAAGNAHKGEALHLKLQEEIWRSYQK